MARDVGVTPENGSVLKQMEQVLQGAERDGLHCRNAADPDCRGDADNINPWIW